MIKSGPRYERPNLELLDILCNSVCFVFGDVIEFGVFDGYSFNVLYNHRTIQVTGDRRLAIAVDTFDGMPESPIAADNERFKPGSFKTYGFTMFQQAFPNASIYQGVIPDILESMTEPKVIAFAHIDLDHEYGTAPALRWVWKRLSVGGIMCIHDYWEDHDANATKAVKDWMKETGVDYVGIVDNAIFFRKVAT